MGHQATEKFSVAVAGSGRLFGMFITECMKRFPKAEIYDRSDKFKAAQQQEIQLGKTKYASPEFRKMALATEKNLAREAKFAVTVTLESVGQVEKITVAGTSSKQTLSLDLDAAKDWKRVETFMGEVLQAVAMAR
jgi:hypothetical protein